MKYLFISASLALSLALPVATSAQATTSAQDRFANNHVEVGVFGDLLRISPANTNSVNYLGLGARLGASIHPNVQLEGEMNYDFEQNYTNTFTTRTGTTTTSTTVTSRFRPITALFGPKFQVGTSGSVRAFLTGKLGFVDFSYSNNAASGSSFASALNQFGNGNSTHFAAYPGGGIEFFAGPLGIRLEAGDEIWVNNGITNSLRVTFGPTFRF